MNKLILFSILIILDFLSKKYVFNTFQLNTFLPLTFFLDITHIHNYGVSFGLFSGTISPIVLIFLSSIISLFIFYLMIKSFDKLEKLGLLIILSGAASNILDRSINGFVIDFIFINYNDFFWPAFNFADIYISIGIIMILSNFFIKIKKKS